MPKIPHRFGNNEISFSQILQSLYEEPNKEFSQADKRKMGKVGELLEKAEILRKNEFKNTLECPNFDFCSGVGKVREISEKYFVDCPECGTLEKIDPEEKRTWLFDWEAFSTLLKDLLGKKVKVDRLQAISLSEVVLFDGKNITCEKESLEEAFDSQETPPAKKTITPKIILPEGTKWEHITIKFINGMDVQILCKKEEIKKTNSLEMGFVAKKGEQESVSWIFLRLLAKQEDNQVSWGDNVAQGELRSRKKVVVRTLKSYFGITDDPFFPTKKIKGYKPIFNLIPEGSNKEPFLNTNWDEWDKPVGIASADL